MESHQKSGAVLMTEGVIWKQIIVFAMPLMIGNLLQQLYNTVDAIVVGRFISSDALAAVSSSNPVINLVIGVFMGIATGAGVVIAQYYGAKDLKRLEQSIHTSIELSFIGGFILIGAGIGLSPFILRLIGTPESVMGDSITYFRIFFSGSLFNLVYNMAAGILRSVGDSRRPLIYLFISSVLNILLDIVLVGVLGFGVGGVATASVISQFVSMALSLGTLFLSDDIYRLDIKKFHMSAPMVKQIMGQGLPAGLQMAVISVSNVIVQAYVNGFGALAMAGYGAFMRIDGFILVPIQGLGLAATTFTAQNFGAGRSDRAKRGLFINSAISAAYTAAVCVVIFVFRDWFMRIFTDDPGVIEYGLTTMYLMLPFYFPLSLHQIFMGTLRGVGKTLEASIASVANMCVLRVIYIWIVMPIFPTFEALLINYPVTWITTMLTEIVFLARCDWTPKGEIS